MSTSAPRDEIEIPTEDGTRLGATAFAVDGSDTALIVLGATAVPAAFYERFARHVQQRGWSALTFDFRGVGRSRPERLRGYPATMSDWALIDLPAAIEAAHRRWQPRRLVALGHSFGGQVVGMLADPSRIDAMVTVSSQSGYWGLQGGSERWRTRVLVHTLLPGLPRLLGYFPWSKIARGEDLPGGVARQWAGWCRSPGYLLDDDSLPLERYEGFSAPILAYSVDDDDWGTARSVDAMMSAYSDVERQHLVPRDEGVPAIGHMGFFRERCQPLWERSLDWLDAKSRAEPS